MARHNILTRLNVKRHLETLACTLLRAEPSLPAIFRGVIRSKLEGTMWYLAHEKLPRCGAIVRTKARGRGIYKWAPYTRRWELPWWDGCLTEQRVEEAVEDATRGVEALSIHQSVDL